MFCKKSISVVISFWVAMRRERRVAVSDFLAKREASYLLVAPYTGAARRRRIHP